MNAADRGLRESAYLGAIEHAAPLEQLVLIALCAELRARKSETAPLEDVARRLARLVALAGDAGDSSRPPPHGELLEIVDRFADARPLEEPVGWNLPAGSKRRTAHELAESAFRGEQGSSGHAEVIKVLAGERERLEAERVRLADALLAELMEDGEGKKAKKKKVMTLYSIMNTTKMTMVSTGRPN